MGAVDSTIMDVLHQRIIRSLSYCQKSLPSRYIAEDRTYFAGIHDRVFIYAGGAGDIAAVYVECKGCAVRDLSGIGGR